MAQEHFDWVEYAEAVAAEVFGACNGGMSRAPEDVRFGKQGSASVNYTIGKWSDFEKEHGGGAPSYNHQCPVCGNHEIIESGGETL
jgi:hypothetical protein